MGLSVGIFRKTSSSWDAYCRHCGKCCYEKYRHRGALYIDYSAPCRFLDLSTQECTIYPQRFRINPRCRKLTIFHALFSPFLPSDCGYVDRFRKFRYLFRKRNFRP